MIKDTDKRFTYVMDDDLDDKFVKKMAEKYGIKGRSQSIRFLAHAIINDKIVIKE